VFVSLFASLFTGYFLAISGQNLAFVKAKEGFLIETHLVDVDVLEPGLDIFIDLLLMLLHIITTYNFPGYAIFGDVQNSLLKMSGCCQLLA
jgi:hypothetical protein